MVLGCEIKLRLGDAWTAYDRIATADALIGKIKCILNQDCEKNKGQMELLSIQGEIGRESKEVFRFGRDVGR
jgi:hypothetical protein